LEDNEGSKFPLKNKNANDETMLVELPEVKLGGQTKAGANSEETALSVFK
jgi:hypothetical protein